MSRCEEEPPSPGAFARDILHSEAVASRYRVDASSDEVVLADYEQQQVEHGYGGWPEYPQKEVVSKQPLKDTEHTGRRVNSMYRLDLAQNGSREAAFVTDYSGHQLRMQQAHSQMAVWAFCDALGLDIPRHHWLPEDEVVAVEEVGTSDQLVQDPVSVEPKYAKKVKGEVLLDYISVQLLAGTEDLLPANFKIDSEGHVYVFDFDKADQRFKSIGALRNACNKAMKTVGVLNKVRDDELGITRDTICSRVQEIATTLHSSVHLDRILGTVELYDDLFEESTEKAFQDHFRNNVIVLSRDTD